MVIIPKGHDPAELIAVWSRAPRWTGPGSAHAVQATCTWSGHAEGGADNTINIYSNCMSCMQMHVRISVSVCVGQTVTVRLYSVYKYTYVRTYVYIYIYYLSLYLSIYLSIYLWVCLCIYIHIFIYIYIYLYIYMHIHVQMHAYVYIYSSVCVSVRVSMNVCMHMLMPVYMSTYSYISLFRHVLIYQLFCL